MSAPPPRARAARALLVVFAVVAVAHLVALLVRAGAGTAGGPVAVADAAVHLTKPALMPLLAGYLLVRGGPPLPAAGLLFGCGGDTFLQLDGDTAFLVGMGSFAAGHVCYLTHFVRRGAPASAALARRGSPAAGRRSRTAAAAAAYAVALTATVALLWPDLPHGLRIPVAGYSLLLTAMAFGALRAGPWAALGGLLFLLSDTLLATGIADWPQLPVPQFWVMLTYTAAQSALAVGILRSAGAGPRPPVSSRPAPVYGEAGTAV
ncbi:lysoplasmalogenase family protein [Streptomyces celluloflavus]|uniref:lysoplasmalogenase family protein n=1 Tax=Streptomyces celluloflavus TaxID=58344 RepID=UPI00365083A0